MRSANFLLVFVVALVLIPVLAVLFSWSSINTELWAHFLDTRLSDLLINTAYLLFGVSIGVLTLGVGLAWLISWYEFPGRRWLEWALMLPMAIPAYVVAFVFLGLFSFTGPIQTFLRESGFGWLNIADIRHPVSISLVMASVLYPYIYLLARNAFMSQGQHYIEAAQSLGASRWSIATGIQLAMARPAIVAGLALAMMETLADFGTVAIFNYDTFTTAIYKAWFDYFDLQLACQLASILLILVSVALMVETRQRGARNFQDKQQPHQRQALSPLKAWCATTVCVLIFSLSFVLPVIQLLIWALKYIEELADPRFLNLLWRTFSLALMAAVLTASVALMLALIQRLKNTAWTNRLITLAKLGYALPGTVLAVGIVMPLGYFEQTLAPVTKALGFAPTQILLGSVFILIMAYMIRFLTVAIGPLETSLSRLSQHIPEAAASLGASRLRVFFTIYLPLIRPGLLLAMLLVFVDVMKEMPATLLMRPFGWDTLAVRIFEMTSEGEYERAALPALCLLLVGLIPMILTIRRGRG
ncbi:MAG: iron ABC transporter permease [Pseudomonadales bacterium]|nr:iron ABC transporter permease [Pseudomonadales bacterium]